MDERLREYIDIECTDLGRQSAVNFLWRLVNNAGNASGSELKGPKISPERWIKLMLDLLSLPDVPLAVPLLRAASIIDHSDVILAERHVTEGKESKDDDGEFLCYFHFVKQ